jgi:hypothetical protein
MLSMSWGTSRLASTMARKDVILKSSEPQKRTRKGEGAGA